MKRYFALCVLSLFLTCLSFPSRSLAQGDRTRIDKSSIPAVSGAVNNFVPAGWKIEEKVAGDLNGDGVPDYALKLVEDKPAKDKDGDATERQRALVIVLRDKDGQFKRAAVTDSLLQCTRCGGAFYGVVESPANVRIAKGVLIVEQDHGSRELSNLTYRFRYEPETQRLALIGFDYRTVDRLTTNVITESTNYLTGVREIFRGKGRRDVKSRKTIPKQKLYIEDVDNDKFEEEVSTRLGA